MLSPEQIEFRKTGLGSSDIATVCGENPFRSPHEVWLDKRGLLEPQPDTLATALGHTLEPFVAQLYADDSGRVARRHQESTRSTEHPIALATIDYETDDDERRIVECKTVGARVAHHWERHDKGCPAYVEIQAQWQMGVLRRARCDVAALFLGFTDFRIYALEFKPDLFASLVAIGERFWQRVQDGEPPPPDETEACRRALLERYKLPRLDLGDAPPGFADLATGRMQLAAEIKAKEAELGTLENRIRQAIGNHEGLLDPEWGRVTWKEDSRGVRPLRFYPAKRKDQAAA